MLSRLNHLSLLFVDVVIYVVYYFCFACLYICHVIDIYLLLFLSTLFFLNMNTVVKSWCLVDFTISLYDFMFNILCILFLYYMFIYLVIFINIYYWLLQCLYQYLCCCILCFCLFIFIYYFNKLMLIITICKFVHYFLNICW